MGVVLVGTIATIGMGRFLDRSRKYLFAMKYVCIGATITMALSVYLFNTGSNWGAAVFCILAGLTIVPILPVCFSLATESTHPVQPALVTGLLVCGSQILGFIVANILVLLLNLDGVARQRLCLYVMGALPFIAIGLSFFVREDLRRLSAILSFGSINVDNQKKSHSGSINNKASSALISRSASEDTIF
jgi:hypothetical protein